MDTLPTEILLEVLELLDPADPGIFALSTSCRRLHFLALPIYLAAHGITDAQALASKDLVLVPDQLDVLRALQTALFIPAVKHVSCSFSLNSARPGYTSRNMDVFFRQIRSLASFLSILERVDRITLDFRDLNFWVIRESLEVLEAWDSVLSTLLDVVLQKHCRTLKVEGGMFIAHPSQLKGKPKSQATVDRWSVVHDVGRRIGSAFVPKAGARQISDSGKPDPDLRTFIIHSRVLLLPPCYKWTIAALNTSPRLTSLSIVRVEIPENNWEDILSNIHVPSLKYFAFELRTTIKTEALDQFFLRHSLLTTLNLGRDLFMSSTLPGEASRDCLPSLINFSASPEHVSCFLTDKDAPSVRNVRLQVKVTSHAVFNAEKINKTLARCHARLEPVHLTLVVMIEYVSSHWTGFFPEDSIVRTKKGVPDALRCSRALEMTSTCPSNAFEAVVLRWLFSFPALESIAFSRCFTRLDALPFVRRVKMVCNKVQTVTLDGTTYDATSLLPIQNQR
ncbi:hypothetical protein DFH08DRAFT_1088734 [Mycena albidolilacea]|uniref:F-box domain-containing protein n=1 Tax=Mycena albidolilacea TaxID=1033008 RepID=A0AAD6Z4X1_9AGAR|nr:hypothetical protein DFH08DRAFT_1088734 [Mycena albidolilacea]